jgi:hypothetical protein
MEHCSLIAPLDLDLIRFDQRGFTERAIRDIVANGFTYPEQLLFVDPLHYKLMSATRRRIESYRQKIRPSPRWS